MLARRSNLRLKNGTTVALPMLVPSFSSKGFGLAREVGQKKSYSRVSAYLDLIHPYLNTSFLLSGYDLHFGHLKNTTTSYHSAALVFIDSGGYELSPDYDSSEPRVYDHEPSSFTVADYAKVLQHLPQGQFIVANFDHTAKGNPVEVQIQVAQKFFAGQSRFLNNFIIKSSGKRAAYLDTNAVVANVAKCRGFNVLGFTEKELGNNLIDRLRTIAKIRAAMDREDVALPIHIWGGLDPLLTPLYFFAGAEIFDGVSWMRYAYWDGLAVSRESYAILGKGIETPQDHASALTLNENITVLQKLTTSFQQFVDGDGKDFDMFEPRAGVLSRAYKTMLTRIPEMKGEQ